MVKKKRIRTKTQKTKRNNMYFLGRREKRKENKITFLGGERKENKTK
jgi:hypothetical protein